MYNSIKRAVAKQLKTVMPIATVYTEDVKQLVTKPAFFVVVIPVRRENESEFRVSHSVIVDVHYIPKDEKREESLEVANVIGKHFKKLTTETDTHTLSNQRINIVDKELHYLFDIDFIEIEREDTTGYDTVDEVTVKIKAEEAQ